MFKVLICFTAILNLTACATYQSDQQYNKIKNISYGSNERQIGDLYLAKKKNQPLILVVHGGGWSGRSLTDMNHIAKSLASHGYNVFNINYRLAPKYKHPAPVQDLKLAVDYIEKNYANQINTDRLGMWGYSSGAHTVLMYGLTTNSSVNVIISGGAPYDFTWWPKSPIITPYMGYTLDRNIKGWMDASPINYLSKESPKLFLYHGEKDRLVQYQQMTAFESKAKYIGANVTTHTVNFWGHMNTLILSQESIKNSILFLNKNL